MYTPRCCDLLHSGPGYCPARESLQALPGTRRSRPESPCSLHGVIEMNDFAVVLQAHPIWKTRVTILSKRSVLRQEWSLGAASGPSQLATPLAGLGDSGNLARV